MTKNAGTLAAVYIYIYIVRFNKVYVNIEEKLCFLDVCKMSNWHSFLRLTVKRKVSKLSVHLTRTRVKRKTPSI